MIAAKTNVLWASLLLLIGSVCAAGAAGAASAPKLRNHFDTDSVGGAPGYFDFVVLGSPGAADWRVTGGSNPPSPPNVLGQVLPGRPADSIAVAVRRNAIFRDGSLSVAMQKGFGRGGVVFRMAGEKDFRALLIDLSTGEARLTASEKGRSVELATGKAERKNQWGILSVTAKGPKITAQWDGQPLLEGTDPRPAAGRAGLATAGPGRVFFDEFLLEPAEE